MANRKRVGSNFDDFLREEGLLDEARAVAAKRVIAFQITQEMKRRKMTKSALALKMKTSRAVLDRLLDPANTSVTLHTLERAAKALDRRLSVRLT
jgi:antitoxin HicB